MLKTCSKTSWTFHIDVIQYSSLVLVSMNRCSFLIHHQGAPKIIHQRCSGDTLALCTHHRIRFYEIQTMARPEALPPGLLRCSAKYRCKASLALLLPSSPLYRDGLCQHCKFLSGSQLSRDMNCSWLSFHESFRPFCMVKAVDTLILASVTPVGSHSAGFQ